MDDLLVQAGSTDKAKLLIENLRRFAQSARTPLNASTTDLADLATGSSFEWLGYSMRGWGSNLVVRIADGAWERLNRGFEKCHQRDATSLLAAEVVTGWLNYLEPFHHTKDVAAVTKEIDR